MSLIKSLLLLKQNDVSYVSPHRLQNLILFQHFIVHISNLLSKLIIPLAYHALHVC